MAARVAGGDRPAACRHPRCAWFRRGAPDAGRSPGSSVEAWGRQCLPARLRANSGVVRRPALTYRCGGSAGIGHRLRPATWPTSRFTRRALEPRGGHLLWW